MTDAFLAAAGKGIIVLNRDENGEAKDAFESEDIAVLSSGLVVFKNDDGTVGTLFGVPTLITEPTWTTLELTAVVARSTQPQPQPNCTRCEDDPTKIAAMNPPVCPKCGGRA